jgi:hypothetical protein
MLEFVLFSSNFFEEISKEKTDCEIWQNGN